jgi:hypothetical protein
MTWFKGRLNERSIGLFDVGFNFEQTRINNRGTGAPVAYIDQREIYFTILDNHQKWVPIVSAQVTSKGRRKRILTSYLASQIIDTDMEKIDVDIEDFWTRASWNSGEVFPSFDRATGTFLRGKTDEGDAEDLSEGIVCPSGALGEETSEPVGGSG